MNFTDGKSQFLFEDLSAPWTFIDSGASVSYPEFEIIAKLNKTLAGSNHKTW